jgi:hypothetical protein
MSHTSPTEAPDGFHLSVGVDRSEGAAGPGDAALGLDTSVAVFEAERPPLLPPVPLGLPGGFATFDPLESGSLVSIEVDLPAGEQTIAAVRALAGDRVATSVADLAHADRRHGLIVFDLDTGQETRRTRALAWRLAMVDWLRRQHPTAIDRSRDGWWAMEAAVLASRLGELGLDERVDAELDRSLLVLVREGQVHGRAGLPFVREALGLALDRLEPTHPGRPALEAARRGDRLELDRPTDALTSRSGRRARTFRGVPTLGDVPVDPVVREVRSAAWSHLPGPSVLAAADNMRLTLHAVEHRLEVQVEPHASVAGGEHPAVAQLWARIYDARGDLQHLVPLELDVGSRCFRGTTYTELPLTGLTEVEVVRKPTEPMTDADGRHRTRAEDHLVLYALWRRRARLALVASGGLDPVAEADRHLDHATASLEAAGRHDLAARARRLRGLPVSTDAVGASSGEGSGDLDAMLADDPARSGAAFYAELAPLLDHDELPPGGRRP